MGGPVLARKRPPLVLLVVDDQSSISIMGCVCIISVEYGALTL
ncbi:hypothetical protein V1293_006684 [Bradyrhizobium sp. AZCC 1693]